MQALCRELDEELRVSVPLDVPRFITRSELVIDGVRVRMYVYVVVDGWTGQVVGAEG